MSDSNDSDQERPPESTSGFDRYRSLIDPAVMILVAKDVVPPFRFKAGGWELLQSSTEIGSAMKARIAEKGFFMFRVNEDQTGGIELTDFLTRSESGN
jgi:hypothetical protein